MTSESGAKMMSSIASLKAAGRGFFFPRQQGGEDRLLLALFAASTVVHIVVLVASDFNWTRAKPLILEEDPIGIDLAEFEVPASPALPKAAPAPEAKVPEQLLPQLPKTFSVKDKAEPEAIAEEKVVQKPEPVKPAEKEQKAPDTTLKTESKTDNQLSEAEIRKRAALEALRREEKTAKTMEAPAQDPLARLAQELSKGQQKSSTFGSAAGKAAARRYAAQLRQAVRQNYNLPEVYNLKGASMQVTIAITVTEHGDLLSLEVTGASGDGAFDEMTVQAVRASVPLPKPPPELVGNPISLVFTP